MGLYWPGTEVFCLFVFLNLLPGDNSPYTESPLDFLATEVEDIGQDIVFFPSLLEEEFSKSEVMAKGGEELMNAQTATPVKQGPVEAHSQTLVRPLVEDLQQLTTPSSETFKHLSTVDTVELREQVSYPESYQPEPEEYLHIDHEESLMLPTSFDQEIATEEVVASSTVPPTTDGTTLVTAETSGHHPSATEILHMWGPNASPATEDDQLFSGSSVVPQEGDLPVVQEDHTTPVIPSEPTTEPKLVLSSTSQYVNVQAEGGDGSGIHVDMSTSTVLTYNKEPGVHFTTVTPPVLNGLHTEGSGNQGENRDSTIESSTNNCVDVEKLFSSTEEVPSAADSSTAGK